MPDPQPLLSPEDAWLADLLRGDASDAVPQGAPDADTIEQLRAEVHALRGVLREAVASPDNPWLWHYFAEQANVTPLPEPSLSEAERRWVQLLLMHSATWQTRWQELEADLGEPVPMGIATINPALDRPPARKPSMARIYTLRRFLVAAVVIVGIYGMLWGASQATTPATYALATLDPYASDLAVLTAPMRDASAPTTDPTVALSNGLQALQTAPSSTLGLFPNHNAQFVEDAIAHLMRAYDASTDPILQTTAAFFLAKAHLMEGDTAQARTRFQEVVQRNTVYMDDAQALLVQLTN